MAVQVGDAPAVAVAADKVVVNNVTGAVAVTGLNVQLECPVPLSVRWSSSGLEVPPPAAVPHTPGALVTGPPSSALGG